MSVSEGHEQTEFRTVVYGVEDDYPLEMDLFLPAGSDRPSACVLFVHGGGWNGGRREAFHWHARQMAGMGFVAASMSYRLADRAPYPAALDDCQRAVRWLRCRAVELDIDPNRIGAFGSSAGGHLVACLGVRDTRNDAVPELRGISSRVQCVVDVHGVHDFPPLDGQVLIETTRRFLGGSLAEKPEAWSDASPLRFVDPRSAPTLLVHAPDDPTVPFEQSVSFAAALMAAGRPVEFLPLPGAGHGFVYSPENPSTRLAWAVATAWLRRHLASCHTEESGGRPRRAES